MGTVRISKPYTMPVEEVREAAHGLAEQLEEKHGVRPQWQGDTVRVKASGMDGTLSFADGVIELSVKLGLMASMFEPVLKKEVQRYLDEHIT